jgi:polysaccharide biosynthesis protein PelC
MRALLILAIAFASGCTVIDRRTEGPPLERGAKWALLPIVNHTDVPQAGLRAEAITEGVLRARGVTTLLRYPPALNPEALFEPAERKVQDEARNWARGEGARYAVYGAVDEWRYKVGIDGEPAVGLALTVLDLQSGEVVWSAVGAKSGWSREALSAVAQKLVRQMVASARLQ